MRFLAACLRMNRDSLGDREGQREPVVVVGVLSDQVYATGSEGTDALT